MLLKYIVPGDRVELTISRSGKLSADADEDRKIYVSKVNDVLSDERLEIVMPIEKTKLVLLPVDAECEICFYAKSGVFECKARVIDRYKSDGVYLLLFELTSDLRKNQRREFYRFSCTIDMDCRALVEEEMEAMQSGEEKLNIGLPLERCIIVDISGGGMRFVSEQKHEEGTLIYFTYSLFVGGRDKTYELIGKVLKVNEIENRRGQYEHRIQYINISNKEREEIVRYIFEEERKNRLKR